MNLETFMECIGWFDGVSSEATHDPMFHRGYNEPRSGHDTSEGLCLSCEKPLNQGSPAITVCLRDTDTHRRRFFYRRHEDCPAEGCSDKAWAAIDKVGAELPGVVL